MSGRRVFTALLLVLGALAARADESDVDALAIDVQGKGGVTLRAQVFGVRGSPEALIVIHGGPGLSHEYLASLGQLANARMAVVLYDQRGVGASSRPADRDYGIPAQVADLEAVRVAVGAERIHVLGHSWGTLVAIVYAAAHPEHTASVILVGMGAPTQASDERTFGPAFAARKAALVKAGIISRDPPDDCARIFNAILPVHFANPRHPGARALPGSYRCDVGRATHLAAGAWDMRSDLDALRMPLLLVNGDADVNAKGLEETLAIVEPHGAIRIVLRDCGHFPFIECPEPFFVAIKRFLHSLENDNQRSGQPPP